MKYPVKLDRELNLMAADLMAEMSAKLSVEAILDTETLEISPIDSADSDFEYSQIRIGKEFYLKSSGKFDFSKTDNLYLAAIADTHQEKETIVKEVCEEYVNLVENVKQKLPNFKIKGDWFLIAD